MNLYCNGSNMHMGGGKTLIVDFINNAISKKNINFIIFVDRRLILPKKIPSHIKFIVVNKYLRIFIDFYLLFRLRKDDILINLGNLPPLISFSCFTFLLQSNRFLVESYSTAGMKISKRINILFQRISFKIFKKNVDQIIVQSETMKKILDEKISRYTPSKVRVIAYKNTFPKNKYKIKKKYDFIYIASDEDYKNHENLLKAWVRLSNDFLYPSLCLVLPKESNVKKNVLNLLSKDKNIKIFIFDSEDTEDAINLLKLSKTLIFPSKFESYGLPIVEAKMQNLKIIASEKDYVRDLIDPEETFDPDSDLSIYRAVKRFMNKKDKKTKIVSSMNFIDYVLLKGDLPI